MPSRSVTASISALRLPVTSAAAAHLAMVPRRAGSRSPASNARIPRNSGTYQLTRGWRSCSASRANAAMVAVDRGDVADLEVGHDPEPVAEQLQHAVARGHRQLDDGVGVVAPRDAVRRPGERVVQRRERLSDQRRVADLLGELQRLRRPLAGDRHGFGRGGGDRQAGQQHRPQRGCVVRKEVEGVGDERGLFVTRDGDLPRHRTCAHPEHGSGQELRRGSIRPGQLRGIEEAGPSALQVAGEQERIALLDEQHGTAMRIRRPAAGGTREASGGFVVGEHPLGSARGLFPLHRRRLGMGRSGAARGDRRRPRGRRRPAQAVPRTTAATRRCRSARCARIDTVEDDVAHEIVTEPELRRRIVAGEEPARRRPCRGRQRRRTTATSLIRATTSAVNGFPATAAARRSATASSGRRASRRSITAATASGTAAGATSRRPECAISWPNSHTNRGLPALRSMIVLGRDRRDGPPDCGSQQLRRGGMRQARNGQRDTDPGELGDMLASELVGPVGADEQTRHVAQRRGHEATAPGSMPRRPTGDRRGRRRAVRSSNPPDDLCDGFGLGEARGRRRRRRLGGELAERLFGTGELAKDLHPQPQRRGALPLPRRRPRAARTPIAGQRDNLLGETGLADPGLAGQQQQPAARAIQISQVRSGHCELPLTAHQTACNRQRRKRHQPHATRPISAERRRLQQRVVFQGSGPTDTRNSGPGCACDNLGR